MIRIDGLTKNFGDLSAVKDLTIHVRSGEIYGFLGPNGAGKTTTIKIIVGLLKASGGRVSVAGHDVAGSNDEAKRQIGYIPDEPHPYERLTGREFLLTMGALYGVKPRDREKRVREALEFFELGAWADELTESYSHGMKQKLMISAALMHRPRVLVADEPLVGLDPRSAVRLKQLFRRHVQEGGSILLATHILEIAERLCDRAGIILEGKLVAEGTIAQLRARVSSPGMDMNLEEIFLSLTAGGAESAVIRGI